MSKSERVKMSYTEKNILLANIELVKEQREFKRDISILISYIKGNTSLKREVASLIERYTTKEQPGKYD